MSHWMLSTAIALTLLPAAAFAAGTCTPSAFPASTTFLNGTIAGGVDGDTFKVTISGQTYSVRMLNIDTPETHFHGLSQGNWGEQAATRAAQLMPAGKAVRIELSIQHCDTYGRILGYAVVGGQDINALMVEEGLAVNYCISPNLDRCAAYAALAKESITARRGFFSDSSVEIPYEWRLRMSGGTSHYYVGNIETRAVSAPSDTDLVPVYARVFFTSRISIVSPYYLVN